MSVYLPSIPQATDTLSVSQGQILGNFTTLNNVFGIDHTAFDQTVNAGWHKSVHQYNDGTPSTTQNVFTFYTKPVIPATSPAGPGQMQWFAKNGLTASSSSVPEMQMTGYNRGVKKTSGYQYLGGIILQWGFYNGTLNGLSNPNSLAFLSATTINFPNNLINVQLTPVSSATPPNLPGPSNPLVLIVDMDASSNTQFTWAARTDATNYLGFNWIAIGY